MNKCTSTIVKHKLIINALFLLSFLLITNTTYNQSWLGWTANLLLCSYAMYKCKTKIDIIPVILAITINPKNPTDAWLIMYSLYIMYFMTHMGLPIIGTLEVIAPLMLMKNNTEYATYRIIAVILSALWLYVSPNLF